MTATHRAAKQSYLAVRCVKLPIRGIAFSPQSFHVHVQRRYKGSSSRIPISARPSRVAPRSAPARHAPPARLHKGNHPSFHPAEASTTIEAAQSPARETVPERAGPIAIAEEAEKSSAEVQIPSSIEDILGQDTLVVTRQVEMMNIFLGFEQANKYALNTAQGDTIGYLAESEKGVLGGSIQRQVLRTHRSFEAHILDTNGNIMMIIRRAFTFINSKISIFAVDSSTKEETLIGEVHQIFHVIRRKYELFINKGGEKGQEDLEQFADIDEGLWAWDFMLKDDNNRPLGAISRNFRGFGRELFTDTGQYVVTFDPTTLNPAPQIEDGKGDKNDSSLSNTPAGKELTTSGPARNLTMQERAVALATAISADFDYFSRHSHGGAGGGLMPWFWMGGGGTPKEAETPTSGSDGGTGPATGAGAGDGAGSGAGYEPNPTSDQAPPSYSQPSDSSDFGQGYDDVWGKEDPWAEQGAGEEAKSGWGWGNDDGGGGGGGEGGGGSGWFEGFFD